MKKVIRTIYIAKNGEEFENIKDCKQYEADGCVHLYPLPKFGEHDLLTQDAVMYRLNGDGTCYYATATKMSRKLVTCAPHPAWATHIIYFGK